MTRPLAVLLVEDSAADAEEIIHVLKVGGFAASWQRVENELSMRTALLSERWDIVIADHLMPEFSSTAALQTLQTLGLDIPFIIVSGAAGDELAMTAMKAGASDFLQKSSLRRLIPVIERELVEFRNRGERDLALKKLQESEERFRLIVESAHDYAIFMLDKTGNIVTWNIGASRMFGYPMLAAIGMHISQLYPDQKLPLAPAGEQLAALPNQSEEILLLKQDGSSFWTHSRTVPMNGADDLLIGYSQMIRDIDQRVQMDIALAAARLDADASAMAKTAFLANISHEIRTPLNAVLGFAALIDLEETSAAERTSYVKTITRNGIEVCRLLDEILDLSKLEAKLFTIDKQWTPLSRVIVDVIALLKGQSQSKGIELSYECEPHAPIDIFTDPQRLRQILINAIGNAIKFTRTGEVKLSVRWLADDRASEMLQLRIIDTGCGIPQDQQHRLFQPFMQIDNSFTRVHGGSGLGLALSKRLAQALGGDFILAKSEVGVGSEFQVTIATGSEATRLHSKVESQAVDIPENLTKSMNGKSLDGIRILVVEDSEDSRRLVSIVLKKSGAIVDLAKNGEEGVAMASRNVHDIVLMDIQMPLIDGYLATATLRQGGFSKPIIALTAHAIAEERERCMQAGFDDFLSKPVPLKELVPMVVSHVKSRLDQLNAAVVEV